jgi:hypothetical protein
METNDKNELAEVTHDVADISINTSVGVYDRIKDPMMAIKTLGMSIFKSGLFGLDRPEQGDIIAMQCMVEKKSPLELVRTYHLINGQLAIRADALLAKFQMAGGKVNWTNRTDKLVEAVFERNGQSVSIVADIQEYINNGTAIGKDKQLKDNWKRWPRRMLTARAISEGVRLIAPECCFGTYVAEELDGVGRKQISDEKTLNDIFPTDDGRKAALKVLVQSGIMSEDKTWDEIPYEVAQRICKNPQIFIEATKKVIL